MGNFRKMLLIQKFIENVKEMQENVQAKIKHLARRFKTLSDHKAAGEREGKNSAEERAALNRSYCYPPGFFGL